MKREQGRSAPRSAKRDETSASLYAAARPARFYVYAVELARPGSPAIYVGSSALPPGERFARHKQGGVPTSGLVRRQGVRLRPELYAHLNPLFSRVAAVDAEHALRDALEARGYRVFGSCDPRKGACFF